MLYCRQELGEHAVPSRGACTIISKQKQDSVENKVIRRKIGTVEIMFQELECFLCTGVISCF